MKKYNACMPIVLEFERRTAEIRLRDRNRRLKGLEPIKQPKEASEASEGCQSDFKDNEPIPYRLTPLGCAVVEHGLIVGEIHTIGELKSYEEWRNRMNKRARRSMKKNKNIDSQRNCQQLSLFENERRDG